MSCKGAAEALVVRAAALGQHGRKLTADEREQVVSGIPNYPSWLLELLSSVPLCGLWLGWQGGAREHHEVQWMQVSDAELILRECVEAYPGIDLLPGGYVSIGADDGGGAAYFVSANKGDDPPLY
jgi:hypothetical protein